MKSARLAAASVLVLALVGRAETPATGPAAVTPLPNAVRVACVGDSITEGFPIPRPEVNGYPAALNRILGNGYDVRNFGAGGTTCLIRGDRPFATDGRRFFDKALAFKPNVVVLMLGTNDSKADNFKFKDEFALDLGLLVDHFLLSDPKPKIYLALPAPAFSRAYDINNENLEKLVPVIRKVAAAKGATLIDVRSAMKGQSKNFPDGIHPNAEAAQKLAETVAAAVGTKKRATR